MELEIGLEIFWARQYRMCTTEKHFSRMCTPGMDKDTFDMFLSITADYTKRPPVIPLFFVQLSGLQSVSRHGIMYTQPEHTANKLRRFSHE